MIFVHKGFKYNLQKYNMDWRSLFFLDSNRGLMEVRLRKYSFISTASLIVEIKLYFPLCLNIFLFKEQWHHSFIGIIVFSVFPPWKYRQTVIISQVLSPHLQIMYISDLSAVEIVSLHALFIIILGVWVFLGPGSVWNLLPHRDFTETLL